MINQYAPIVLFVYNRPIHTQKTIIALQANVLASQSDLYVFSDAPKKEIAFTAVKAVREYISTIKGFKSINIIERETNFGLAKSIAEGVTQIVNQFGKIIVLEDDLITHPQFLEFTNQALLKYENVKDVYQITGYSFFTQKSNSKINQTYLLPLTCTWGWATWANRWEVFTNNATDGKELINNKKLIKLFNYHNSYNFYKIFKDRETGKSKSWGILWYWSVFKLKGLILYPTQTLIDQIGFDGSGQNSKNYTFNELRIKSENYDFVFTNEIEELPQIRKQVVKILKSRKVLLLIKICAHKLGLKKWF